MKNLQEFKFDDIPFLGHMAIEGDRERLHIMRLIEFQLPEIQSGSAQPCSMVSMDPC